MDVTDRFARQWERWDEAVRSREDAGPYLAAAKDEELVELLAGESDRDRKYERDIVATEIANRLARRNRGLPQGAEDVLRSAEAAYKAAAEGQKAIHTAEAILKASGEQELGVTVSSSAYASLDTTKLALEAAQDHASEVQAAVAQSRFAERLVQDAADVAREAAQKAGEGAARIEALGHGTQAAKAREAAEALHDAARQVDEATGSRAKDR